MITDHYSLVELVLGIGFTLWGVSSLFNKNILKSHIHLFLSDEETHETISYLVTTMFLILGAIIISVHNDWYVGLSLITTIIGWALVIKCFLWLSFRKFLKPTVKNMKNILLSKWMHLGYSSALVILGLATLWNHVYLSV